VIRSKLEALLVALAVVLVLLLVGEEVSRVLFPWDLRYFSESPFLTDMMKLSSGAGVYTAPEDGNSYIYAPGLGYVTYAILRPLGAQLDIRACRAVTVAIGFASAAVAGGVTHRFLSLLGGRPAGRGERITAMCAAALVIFINYTADACHPDNLYGLHAMALIALTFAAVDASSYRRALVAVALAAVGIAAKQTAVLGLVGSLAVLLYFCGRRWGAARSSLLVAWGLGLALVVAFVAFRGWGWVWAFEVVSHQSVEPERAPNLLAHYVNEPHRLFLSLTFLPCAFYVFLKGSDRTRKLWAVWLAVGVTEAWPALLSYFKAWGYWNNLIIIDLWASLPVVAVLLHALHTSREKGAIEVRAAAGGALGIFLVSLVPTRSAATHGQYEFGRALDEAVASDVQQGKRVLVSHGAATLVHAGALDVPLDRAISISELGNAHMVGAMAATNERFASKRYDKIYLVLGYAPEVQSTIEANYHQTGQIPGDNWHDSADRLAVQSFMVGGARILEPNR
jgi:hypothetical protein